MKDYSISLLKELTEAPGISGYEQVVRNIFKQHVKDDFITDKTGSIYVCKKGYSEQPKIMVSGHLDEVGFVVKSITREGFLHFIPSGGIWGLTMLSHRVKVILNDQEFVRGAIVYKSPHFLNNEDKTKFIPPSEMFIDIGAKDYNDAINNYKIAVGQQVTFDSEFVQLSNPNRFMAKAFDNRIGVGLAITIANSLLNIAHPNTVFLGANAQEEVKARGAITAANLINPDIGIVIEGPPADDTPGIEKHSQQSALGAGVQIRIMDSSAIMNQQFNQFIINIAQEINIPYQLSVNDIGGTDAHAIHLNQTGTPTCVLGVPVRYSHTSNSIMDINDYLNTKHLIVEMIKRLDKNTVNGFTKF